MGSTYRRSGDYETHEIDFEAPEVREQLHPLLADEAKTAQFLASKGEALSRPQCACSSMHCYASFSKPPACCGVERPATPRLIITF
jgi:hypothetical protein